MSAESGVGRVQDVAELVDIEATPAGTTIEVLRIVNPKDLFEPVKTRIIEWLDEATFRSTEIPGDPLQPPAITDQLIKTPKPEDPAKLLNTLGDNENPVGRQGQHRLPLTRKGGGAAPRR